MSERSSWATEFIYCPDCAHKVKEMAEYLGWDYATVFEEMPGRGNIITAFHGGIGPYDDESNVALTMVRLAEKIEDACTLRIIFFPDAGHGGWIYRLSRNKVEVSIVKDQFVPVNSEAVVKLREKYDREWFERTSGKRGTPRD